MRRFHMIFRFLIMAVVLGAALIATSVGVAAQELTVDLPIVKLNCPYDPGDVSLSAGNIPDECTEVAGVAFAVRDEAGDVIGECTTDASGTCRITVVAPEGPTRVFVVEDVTTATPGFVPRANPVEAFIGVPEAAALVINIPTEEAQADTIGLGIRKFNCPSAADFEAGSGSCELGAGVSFEVATADGETLGTCTTEIAVVQTTEVAICYVVDVPFDTPLVITEDVSTGPAGYVPLENPQTMTIQRPELEGQDFAPSVNFVNVPAETGNGDDGTDGGPVVVDPVSCGHFESQEDAQAYFDEYQLDDPSVLDPDGDGIACEFAFDEEASSGGDTDETTEVVALPKTGAGTAATGDQSNHVLAVTLMLASAMAMGMQRRLSR